MANLDVMRIVNMPTCDSRLEDAGQWNKYI